MMALAMDKIDKVLKEAKEAKEEVKNLGIKYDLEVAQKRQLTEDLGIARVENQDLRKKLEKMEKENAKLRDRLSVFQEKKGVSGQGTFVQNEKGPLDIFPEEIWNMIFGYLKNPRDLKSCYETCADFQDMLETQKQVFLFVDVINLLPSLSTSNLLKCRLVCSRWKESVDNFLQRDPEIFSHEPRWRNATGLIYYGRGFGVINPTVNPILGRYLRYAENTRSDYESFNYFRPEYRRQPINIMDALRLYGHHVWFFKVEFDGRDNPYSSASAFMYTEQRNWLSLMPNLKGLYLHQPSSRRGGRNWWEGFRRNHIDIDEDYNTEFDNDSESENEYYDYNRSFGEDRINKCMLKDLKAESTANSFPTIPTLKTVIFEDCPPRLVKSVLMSNPQIERLTVDLKDTEQTLSS